MEVKSDKIKNLKKSEIKIPLNWPEPTFILQSEVKKLKQKLVKMLLKNTSINEAAALEITKKWIKDIADENTFV